MLSSLIEALLPVSSQANAPTELAESDSRRVTTSYPCPNPDTEELLHRRHNPRNVSSLRCSHSTGGRPSSCAGRVQVQPHHLGHFESCSWCSMTAKLKYAEAKGRQINKKENWEFSGGKRGWA